MKKAVIIKPNDTVITVIEGIQCGDSISYNGCTEPVVAVQDIPIYHKVAISEVRQGEYVLKYGEKIGVASKDIHIGEHVHSHNIVSERA